MATQDFVKAYLAYKKELLNWHSAGRLGESLSSQAMWSRDGACHKLNGDVDSVIVLV